MVQPEVILYEAELHVTEVQLWFSHLSQCSCAQEHFPGLATFKKGNRRLVTFKNSSVALYEDAEVNYERLNLR